MTIIALNNAWYVTGCELLNGNFNIYDPVNFKLITQDGTEYIINKNTGVKSITEPNGNTITFEKRRYCPLSRKRCYVYT